MHSRMWWRALRARYRDEKVELAAIRSALRAGGTAVDVGANRGSYLFWLARWARNGRVVAFEPQETLADYLRRVAADCAWTNVVVESNGVGDANGEFEFFVPAGEVTPGASFSRRVPGREQCAVDIKQVVTLDAYFGDRARIDVIKIDVEGRELAVLRGAAKILASSAPLLVFECESRHLERGSVRDVLQFLWDMGYDGSFVRAGRLIPARDFDAEVHQREIGERFFAARGYCNNFIFRRA